MTPVCLTCGYKDDSGTLIYCNICQDSALHWYCLEILPKTRDENVEWICEECLPKTANSFSSRKSERINSRKNQAGESRKQIKKCLIAKKISIVKQMSHRNDEVPKASNITSNLSSSNEEIDNICFSKRTNCNLEIKRQRRKLVVDESSSDESESIKVESPQLVSNVTEEGFPKVNNLSSRPSETSELKGLTKDQTDVPATDYRPCNKIITPTVKTHVTAKDKNPGLHPSETSEMKSLRKDRIEVLVEDYQLCNENISRTVQANNNKHETKKSINDCQVNISSSPHLLESQKDYVPSYPIRNPIWRGSFNICNENYGNVGLTAHVSSKACLKVTQATIVLPQVLEIIILPKADTWPRSFQITPPTDESIGVYFFPEYERDEVIFESILDNLIEHGLALKAVINQVELLVFSSLELPQEHWRYRRNYYMWGVYRKHQASLSSPTS